MSKQKIETNPTERLMENMPLMLTVLLLVDSLHFVFGRLLGQYLPPTVSAFYVLAVATVQVGLFMAWRGMIRFSVLRQNLWFFISIGFLVAGATMFSYLSVTYVDAGTASLLGRSGVVFTLLLGLFWLKERLTRMQWLGTAVALSGAIIIGFQPGELLRLGSLFVLLSSFMYALHVAIVKRYGGEIEFANFFLYRVAFTTAFLLLFVIGQRQMVWPTGEVWIFLILTGTVDVVISRVLYYLALRQMTLSMHTIILMLSPVITIGWSLLLFGEAPTLQSFIGGVVIIGGILIVNFARK